MFRCGWKDGIDVAFFVFKIVSTFGWAVLRFFMEVAIKRGWIVGCVDGILDPSANALLTLGCQKGK